MTLWLYTQWMSRTFDNWRPTLDAAFCVAALEDALGAGAPEVFNTDQGAQFTSLAFTGRVLEAGAECSMDGYQMSHTPCDTDATGTRRAPERR